MTYIKGLLFDKDGTLFDFHNTWSVWCHRFITDLAQENESTGIRLAQALDFDMQNCAFRQGSIVIAGTLETLVDVTASVLPSHAPEDIRESIMRTGMDAKMAPAVPLVPLLDGFLNNGLKLGVATNDGEVPARAHLRSADIHDHFHFIAGYDTGHGAKPEPGMLLAFCTATGLNPSEVAMIGDSTHDLHSGKAAGMVRVGVLTGPANHDDLVDHADVVFPDIGHLPDWLQMRNGAA